MSDLLFIDEVSEMSRVPIETLRWWRKQNKGVGPTSGVLGGRIVYKRDEVIAWIESAFEDGAAS